MKKLLFAFCVMFGVVVVNAQDTTSTTSPSGMAMQEDGRVKIKSQELPEAIKSSLESQEFRGWLVSSAYKIESASGTASTSSSDTTSTGVTTSESDTTGLGDEGTGNMDDTTGLGANNQTGAYAEEIYIVELKNGAQTKTVRFDKDGKKLDDTNGMDGEQK